MYHDGSKVEMLEHLINVGAVNLTWYKSCYKWNVGLVSKRSLEFRISWKRYRGKVNIEYEGKKSDISLV